MSFIPGCEVEECHTEDRLHSRQLLENLTRETKSPYRDKGRRQKRQGQDRDCLHCGTVIMYGFIDPDYGLAIILCNGVESLVQVNISQPDVLLPLTESISLRNRASLALDRALKLRIIWIWKRRCCLVRRQTIRSTSMYDRPASENNSC